MGIIRWIKPLIGMVVVGGVTAGAYVSRDRWQPLLHAPTASTESEHDHASEAPAGGVGEQVHLSEPAQKNLNLVSKPLAVETFWRTISVPGMVIDRPGRSDRGIVAPLTGVVTRIEKLPGEVVQPGDVLFRLRLLSESLYLTQTELFKASQDIRIATEQKTRLTASAGAISEARIIDVTNQITRLEVSVKAYRQELLNRGFSLEQIESAATGKFVAEIDIKVPPRNPRLSGIITTPASEVDRPIEMQELKVELGQQVQAGQTMCLLANHHLLALEGRAYRDETPLLERAVQQNWPVTVDFQEDATAGWPTLGQPLMIRYLSNTIDPVTRTFSFLIPFENQSKTVESQGTTQTLWRYRPGQRVRLQVRVEKLENVFVLPPEAIAHEGAETYVFRQNGDIFERKPVHVLLQDRQNVVIANDGSVPPGIYIAQTGAIQLNRMLKSQTSTLPKGAHMHADGSIHLGSH